MTIVFADPKPSERSGAEITPDVTHAIMSRYIEVVRPILEGHGGTVEKFIGDAVMAVFGLPVRHEDDAVRAVRAAADVQQALRALNEELDAACGVTFANPIGVNTGTVVAGDAVGGERLVTGDAVNVAARLEQTAAPGEVILGELTHHLAERRRRGRGARTAGPQGQGRARPRVPPRVGRPRRRRRPSPRPPARRARPRSSTRSAPR